MDGMRCVQNNPDAIYQYFIQNGFAPRTHELDEQQIYYILRPMLERAVLTAEYSAILDAEFRVLARIGYPIMKLVGQVHATLNDVFAHTLCLMQLSNYFAPVIAKSQKRY